MTTANPRPRGHVVLLLQLCCAGLGLLGCSRQNEPADSMAPASREATSSSGASGAAGPGRAEDGTGNGATSKATLGAGMPLVPIHRADAGEVHDAAASPSDASQAQIVDNMSQGQPVPAANADADMGASDGGPGMPLDATVAGADEPVHADAQPPDILPAPVHRFDFSGLGSTLHDTQSDALAQLQGSARLDGRGAVQINGDAGAGVRLPDGLLAGLSDFTLLVWLQAGSQDCWTRMLELTSFSRPATMQQPPPPSSLHLTPYGCPDAPPTLGYADENSAVSLTAAQALRRDRTVQLGAAFVARSQTLRLIVDGTVAAEMVVAVDTSALERAQGWLGRAPSAGGASFSGRITELRVYAQALAAAQLQQTAARGPDDL